MKESEWKNWLREHIREVLIEAGIEEDQRVLDFGCNSGAYTIPAARLFGKEGKVYAIDKNSEAFFVQSFLHLELVIPADHSYA